MIAGSGFNLTQAPQTRSCDRVCGLDLEIQSRLELESSLTRFAVDGAEGSSGERLRSQVRRTYRRSEESSLSRRRMIENVGSIHPDRHAFGFTDSNLFLDGHVGCPSAKVLKLILTKSATFSRKRGLQHDLVRSGNPDGIERAVTRQIRHDVLSVQALRVSGPVIDRVAIGICKDITRGSAFHPGVVLTLGIEWTDNIRHSQGVEHAL